jgi:hypothetical protein
LLLRRRRAGLLDLRGIALRRWLMRGVALLRLCGRLAWLLLQLRRGRVALVRGVALLLRRIALLLLLGCGRLAWLLLLLLQLLGLLRVGLRGLLEALLRGVTLRRLLRRIALLLCGLLARTRRILRVVCVCVFRVT